MENSIFSSLGVLSIFLFGICSVTTEIVFCLLRCAADLFYVALFLFSWVLPSPQICALRVPLSDLVFLYPDLDFLLQSFILLKIFISRWIGLCCRFLGLCRPRSCLVLPPVTTSGQALRVGFPFAEHATRSALARFSSACFVPQPATIFSFVHPAGPRSHAPSHASAPVRPSVSALQF
jgi:hypothetical protein